MNYLLDTHACIWAIGKQTRLSVAVKDILQNADNRFWVSKISLLEIAIKRKVGKLPEFDTSFHRFIDSIHISGYKILSLKEEHLETYNLIDFHETHRDPFDRYLLAAARSEDFAIITKDEKFHLYTDTIKIVW